MKGELDETCFPDFRDRILRFEGSEIPHESRTYPGYPRVALPRARARLFPSLDRVLARRRTSRGLAPNLPTRDTLGRLLRFSHGVTASRDRGPAPSAGGLQAMELYLAVLEGAWLDAGIYHYDRRGHHLSRVAAGAPRAAWSRRVPSMAQYEGGALLFIIVGDAARVGAKYGDRGERLLLLEAGHLAQNICLLSASLGLAAIPLGGFFEEAIARELALPPGDLVLYVLAGGLPV